MSSQEAKEPVEVASDTSSERMFSSLRTYVIYLERNQDRLANVQTLLKTLPNAQIYPAVDGRLVNFAINGLCSGDKIRIHEDRYKLLENGQQDQPQPDTASWCIAIGDHLIKHRPEFRLRERNLRLGYGECGCLLSHWFLWNHLREILPENEPALIVEDDAVCDDLSKFWSSVLNLPDPKTWDVAELFTTTGTTKRKQVNDFWHTILPVHFNRASAYLLTRRGVIRILEALETVGSLDLPADDIISRLHLFNRIEVLFPTSQVWNHLERDGGWVSSMWNSPEEYLSVAWNRSLNLNWVGVELGSWTGIGNQMFQWSAVKVISMRLGVRMLVKPSGQFLLNNFPYIRSWQEWVETAPSATSLRNSIVVPESEWNKAQIWKESSLAYDSGIEELKANGNWRVEGYLQHIRYIEPYIPLLRMIFEFEPEVKTRCETFLRQIQDTISESPIVAIHLRLPNLHDEPFENSCYSFPTKEFIQDSMNWYMEKWPNVRFVVCSNDINRAYEVYDFLQKQVIWAGLGLMEDMCFMSLCDHYILSPSTYGYWSAILNPNPDKCVIACKPFFNRQKCDNLNEEHDLIFPGWNVYDMEGKKFV